MKVNEDFEFISSDGLFIEATTDASSMILKKFFHHYDHAFILPDEKETINGFRECLNLNTNKIGIRLSALYGPHFEVICNIYESLNRNNSIGGINFICYPVEHDKSIFFCSNLNYVFINPQYRGLGYLRKFINATKNCMDHVLEQLESQPDHLIFVEQNDPFRLTIEEYRQDTEHGGLDQLDRLRIWARLGFMIIDFPYIQPPLSEDQEPDDGLLYSILADHPFNDLTAALMQKHLERFFAISVLKGSDPYSESTAAKQLNTLREIRGMNKNINLIDPTEWLKNKTVNDVISIIKTQSSKISLLHFIK